MVLSNLGWGNSDSIPRIMVQIDPTSNRKDIISIKWTYEDQSGIHSDKISTSIIDEGIRSMVSKYPDPTFTMIDFLQDSIAAMEEEEIKSIISPHPVLYGDNSESNELKLVDMFVGQICFYLAFTAMMERGVLDPILPFRFDLPPNPHEISRSNLSYMMIPIEAARIGNSRIVHEISWLLKSFVNSWSPGFQEGDYTDTSRLMANMTMQVCLATISKLEDGRVENEALKKELGKTNDRLSMLELEFKKLASIKSTPPVATILPIVTPTFPHPLPTTLTRVDYSSL
jgi:hypothetical protein